LEAMPSSKAHLVEALLYAAFITMVVSRTLIRALRLKLGKLAERCPAERWAAVFRTVAADPNASRVHLLRRSEGLQTA
jgi:hypothetical protein